MDTKIISLLSLALYSVVTSAPQDGWMPPNHFEECTKVHTEAMVRCLTINKIPESVTSKCRDANYQNNCEIGMRQVIHLTDKCVSTKCIKNSSGGEICKNGELPYKGGCHKIGSSNVCARKSDFTPKRTLQSDIFGNVSCQCIDSLGLVNFNGDCYSESSFSPCSQAGSSRKLLIRFGHNNTGQCIPNRCKEGQVLWRRFNCSKTESKNDYLNSCFDCMNFDDHVKNCQTHLLLKDGIVTCAPKNKLNSVFDTCPEQASTTGECIKTTKKPGTKPISNQYILMNLCKVNKEAVELTGFQCN